MKKLLLMFVLVIGVCGTAYANDDNRYTIVASHLKERDGVNPMTILLDTKTGRTWYLTSSLYWEQLRVKGKKEGTMTDRPEK